MSDAPQISVVVPTYNRADALGLTLEHLGRQSLAPDRYEVLVVDDGSTDETARVVRGREGPFRLACLEQRNQGAAAARNLGTERAAADIVVYVDADVVPDRCLLERHLEEHAIRDRPFVVGRVRTWHGTGQSWYEQAANPDVGMDLGESERTVPFYVALGGNLSIRKQLWRKGGGFDETFPAAGCEETEFAYRVGLLGHALFYQPRAVGYHNHPRTLRQRCEQQVAHMRSMALLIGKHSGLHTVIHGVDELMPLWQQPLSLKVLLKRVQASIWGLGLSRFVLYEMLSCVDRQRAFPHVASGLFWRLMAGCRYAGFRKGLGQYGSVSRPSA